MQQIADYIEGATMSYEDYKTKHPQPKKAHVDSIVSPSSYVDVVPNSLPTGPCRFSHTHMYTVDSKLTSFILGSETGPTVQHLVLRTLSDFRKQEWTPQAFDRAVREAMLEIDENINIVCHQDADWSMLSLDRMMRTYIELTRKAV